MGARDPVEHDLASESCASKPILFVDHAPALGGAEHNLLALLTHLDRRHWQPHVACAAGPLAERVEALRLSVHTPPLPSLRRPARAPAHLARGIAGLTRTIRDTGAVLLVANTTRAAFYAAPAARLARVPFVWHRQDLRLGISRRGFRALESAAQRLLGATAARIVCCSGATAQQHPRRRKVSIVRNGIEIQRFSTAVADGLAFRHASGIPRDASVVATVGRLCPSKGQDRFLRVLARVKAKVPDVWGVVVGGAIFGEHDYASSLHRLTHELDLSHRVIFTGQLDDPAAALAAADVFVQAGDPEGFGLVNVEAMAAGKAVVAFRHGALPEIVVDGCCGILVDPGGGGETAMAAAVERLLRDPELRARLGGAGQERAADQFTVERFAAEFSAVLHELVSRDPEDSG